MGSLVNRNELRRLEKACKDKDKRQIAYWMKSFEDQVENLVCQDYEKRYQDELHCAIQNMLIAVTFTLFFSEETYIDKENIVEVMAKLFKIFDLFATGKYKPEDYLQKLSEYNIFIDDFDNDWIYKKYLNIFDTELVRLLKTKRRKIVTVIGNDEDKEKIIETQQDLTIQGFIVLSDNVFYTNNKDIDILGEEKATVDDILRDKILISEKVYVIGEDNFNARTKELIEYAKEHEKEIEYVLEFKN